MNWLVTHEPSILPIGSIPMDRAVVCLDCSHISYIGPTCANCASEAFIPLAAWLERERGTEA